MFRLRRDVVSLAFIALSIVFVALALAGAVRAYSPVPYWDMWDGYLGAYVRSTSGDWSVWWAQHNEHRIVLARLIFWIDIAFFHGAGWFLILINCLLLALVCTVFLAVGREYLGGSVGFIGYFLVAWLFSWSQEENLTWGFQCQFILAQLLPLAAFYLLHKSASAEDRSFPYFCTATLFGFLAFGSMANGVLALPLMMLYAVLVRLGWRRSGFLALLSIVGLSLYFHGYHAVPTHGSLGQALLENPAGLVQYVLLYLGGPFYYLAGGGSRGLWLAQIAASALVLVSVVFAWLSLKHPKQSTLPLALLTFVLYVGGSALGTAGGRLVLGLEQALSSRYMTPALMAWAALLVLSAPFVLARARKAGCALLLILLVLMLPYQLKALRSKHDLLFERNVAALALELGVKDQVQIGSVFPSAEAALLMAQVPVERNLSVFGLPPFVDLRERIGSPSESGVISTRECRGHLDEIQLVPEDQHFLRVRGWLSDSAGHTPSEPLSIVDDTGEIVGFALSGQSRPDVAAAVNKAAKKSGFKGYLSSAAQGRKVFVIDKESQCRLTGSVPVSIFTVLDPATDIGVVSVSKIGLLDDSEWQGGDFQKSTFPGMAVLGSFMNSDADVGSLTLRMKRGDRLLYRSGPTAGHQVVEVIDSELPAIVLPTLVDWKILDFSNTKLPDQFRVKFSDLGTGWGEWSAIGVRK